MLDFVVVAYAAVAGLVVAVDVQVRVLAVLVVVTAVVELAALALDASVAPFLAALAVLNVADATYLPESSVIARIESAAIRTATAKTVFVLAGSASAGTVNVVTVAVVVEMVAALVAAAVDSSRLFRLLASFEGDLMT